MFSKHTVFCIDSFIHCLHFENNVFYYHAKKESLTSIFCLQMMASFGVSQPPFIDLPDTYACTPVDTFSQLNVKEKL